MVDYLLTAITDALKQGDEVRLTGFGTFTVATRAAGQARNPRTGEPVTVAPVAIQQLRTRPQDRFTKAYFRSVSEGCPACSVGTSNRSSRTSVLIICATALICLPLNVA